MRSPSRNGPFACNDAWDDHADNATPPPQCTRHTQLFTAMTQGVIYLNREGRITSANPAAERILGLTLDQLASRTALDPRWKTLREDGSAFPASEHPAMLALHSGQAVSEVLMGIFHPGLEQHRWIQVSATPIFRSGESQPFEVLTTFTDITEHKRHEDALRQARQELEAKDALLQHVVDSLPQRLFWKDRNGTFGGCNIAGAQAVGLESPDEIVGKTDYDLYPSHSDGDFFYQQDLGVMESGTSLYHTLAQKQESGGAIKWLDVTKVPLRDTRGNIDGLLVSYEDVTNLNQIEESLRKFKQVVEQSPDAIIIAGLDGNIEYINPAFCHIYGYSPQEVLGHNPRLLKSGHTPPEEYRALWQCVRTGQVWQGEFLNRRKDGGQVWQAATVSPIFDDSGAITHFLSIQEEIGARKLEETARKKAEEDLFNAKQVVQLVLDHIPQQVFWKDLESLYIGGNAAYLATCGVASTDELKGKSDFDLYPPEHARKYRRDERNVMRRNRPRIGFEEPLSTRGRETRWLKTSKVPLHDQTGKVVGVLGMFEDITERKAMRHELADTLQQLRTILDNAQVGIVFLRDNRLIWVNRRLVEMSGYKQKEMLEKSFDVFFPTSEDFRKVDLESNAVLAQGKPYETERLMKRKNGRTFWGHLRGMAVDTRNMAKGSIWTLMDIDRRKAAEQELLELNTTLAQQVCREIANGMEKERLLIQQARHAAMGEMIGNIAHQWRQPLSVLGLILQNIGIDHEDHELSGEALQAYIADAMRAIQQMSDTIDDFRNFFSPSRQKVDFNLRQAIEETLALLNASLQHHNIEIRVSGPEKIEIRGHPNEFSQMLLNLIGNAKDALEARQAERPTIAIETALDGEYATITVHDNAGGVPPEIAEKIFDPYFTTKEKGTGIGLYMTKTILEKHMHGTIAFRNGEHGAEFTINLPLDIAAENDGYMDRQES